MIRQKRLELGDFNETVHVSLEYRKAEIVIEQWIPRPNGYRQKMKAAWIVFPDGEKRDLDVKSYRTHGIGPAWASNAAIMKDAKESVRYWLGQHQEFKKTKGQLALF